MIYNICLQPQRVDERSSPKSPKNQGSPEISAPNTQKYREWTANIESSRSGGSPPNLGKTQESSKKGNSVRSSKSPKSEKVDSSDPGLKSPPISDSQEKSESTHSELKARLRATRVHVSNETVEISQHETKSCLKLTRSQGSQEKVDSTHSGMKSRTKLTIYDESGEKEFKLGLKSAMKDTPERIDSTHSGKSARSNPSKLKIISSKASQVSGKHEVYLSDDKAYSSTQVSFRTDYTNEDVNVSDYYLSEDKSDNETKIAVLGEELEELFDSKHDVRSSPVSSKSTVISSYRNRKHSIQAADPNYTSTIPFVSLLKILICFVFTERHI